MQNSPLRPVTRFSFVLQWFREGTPPELQREAKSCFPPHFFPGGNQNLKPRNGTMEHLAWESFGNDLGRFWKPFGSAQRHTETHTDTQRHTETQHTKTDTETRTHTHRDTSTHTHTQRHTDRQPYMKAITLTFNVLNGRQGHIPLLNYEA